MRNTKPKKSSVSSQHGKKGKRVRFDEQYTDGGIVNEINVTYKINEEIFQVLGATLSETALKIKNHVGKKKAKKNNDNDNNENENKNETEEKIDGLMQVDVGAKLWALKELNLCLESLGKFRLQVEFQL